MDIILHAAIYGTDIHTSRRGALAPENGVREREIEIDHSSIGGATCIWRSCARISENGNELTARNVCYNHVCKCVQCIILCDIHFTC